jgi:hypothetical protein
LGRLLIGVAVVADLVVGLALIAAPRSIARLALDAPSPSVLVLTIAVIAVIANGVGLAWMIRIHRADPEQRSSGWRSRPD